MVQIDPPFQTHRFPMNLQRTLLYTFLIWLENPNQKTVKDDKEIIKP